MCPDAETLSAYFDNEIEFPWNRRVSEHIQGCESCRKRLQEFARVQRRLQEDKEPDYRSSLEELKERLALRGRMHPSEKVPVWRRKVVLPLPIAAVAAVFMLFMGVTLVFRLSRSDFRKMSIKRGPTGTTEVQVAAPIEDLELLLKTLDKQEFKQEIVITLPEGSQFTLAGEPEMLREADVSRKNEW